MRKSCLFTQEEIDKINLSKFITKLFSRYENLHLINIFLYSSKVIQNGKTICIKPKLKIATTFKYDTFYCFWFNGGAQAYQDEEELKSYFSKNANLQILNSFSPVNFYLKQEDKKITYSDFESSILSKKELEEEKVESLFGEKNKISFCRESMQTDLESFFGYELVAKQEAKKSANALSKNLKTKEGSRNYIKI